ncbi:hypothetical protein EVAR_3254_1 [Eumeta japonica]|uniref:Uncharacterized protein n=1 Tax=Eumeta variegata TaxID=151549 RepID=A0A4C1SUY8_EUMVA|nr:hypothetical protein EVAR_3254_1 [Eumeta japonica]
MVKDSAPCFERNGFNRYTDHHTVIADCRKCGLFKSKDNANSSIIKTERDMFQGMFETHRHGGRERRRRHAGTLTSRQPCAQREIRDTCNSDAGRRQLAEWRKPASGVLPRNSSILLLYVDANADDAEITFTDKIRWSQSYRRTQAKKAGDLGPRRAAPLGPVN